MGKNRPLERTPNQSSSLEPLRPAERDKVIEQRPLDQRPKVAPHPHIGLQAFRGAALETKRMFAVDRHHVLDIGAERQPRFVRLVLDAHLDRQKWRVVDLDPDFLDRRHQNIAVALLAHDRGEQLHERRPANRRATIKPCSVGSDAHVDIAAVGRIPRRRRRQAAQSPRRRLAEPSQGPFRRARRLCVILALVCGRI